MPTIKQISYLNVVNQIKQNDYSTLKDCEITNELSFQKVISKQYSYIDISNLEKGSYLLENKLYGWELPNRAKQSVKKYDILISKLAGSLDKFAMILQDNTDNIVATNGCYRIRIEDEKVRLSFYKFLFSKEYKIQMEALATGSIMLDVKKHDLKNNLYFPLLNDDELDDMRKFVKQQEYFVKLRNNL